MNILICMPTLSNGKGGAEKVAVEVGLAMRLRAHNIAWAYKLNKAKNGLRPSYALPVDTTLLPYDATLMGMRDFRARARGFGPDIILGFYANWQLFELYDLFHDFNVPLCFQECSNPERVINHNWAKASNAAAMRAQILQLTAGIRVTREEYKNSFPPEIADKVTAFPNAFIRKKDISKQLSAKTILHVGAAKKNKNGAAMLEAFALLAPRFPGWKLVLCTTSLQKPRPDYEEIKNRIHHEFPPGSVVLHENQEDMDSIYANAAIHCITSFSEGLPNCVCEAMCRGIPSVGFAASTGTNLLIRHNEDGLLAGNSPSELAEALANLMGNEELRQKLGQNAWIAAKQFDPDIIYDKWEDFMLSSYKRAKSISFGKNLIQKMTTDWKSLSETTWREYITNRISKLQGEIIFFGCGNLYTNFHKLFARMTPVAMLVDNPSRQHVVDGIPVMAPGDMDARIKTIPIVIFSKDAKVIEHRLRDQYGAKGEIICIDRSFLQNAFEAGLPRPVSEENIEMRKKRCHNNLASYKRLEEPLISKINRERPACAFCGSLDAAPWMSSNIAPWYDGDQFRLVRCQRCGLIYASPRPPEWWVLDDICQHGEMYYQRKLARNNVQSIHDKLAKEILLTKPEARSVFDVAFGAGTLLHSFRKLGIEAYGNEINAYACRQAAAQGFEVINKPTLQLDFKNRFDIVAMLDYVEHSYTPFDDLLKAREMLRDNGLLYLKTLYLGCPAHLKKGEGWQLFNKGHFYYYLPEVIMGMVENAGFNIISVRKGGLIHIAATKR